MELCTFIARRLKLETVQFEGVPLQLQRTKHRYRILSPCDAPQKHTACYNAEYIPDSRTLKLHGVLMGVLRRLCQFDNVARTGTFLMHFTDALAHCLGAETAELFDASTIVVRQTPGVPFAGYRILTHPSALSWYESLGFHSLLQPVSVLVKHRQQQRKLSVQDCLDAVLEHRLQKLETHKDQALDNAMLSQLESLKAKYADKKEHLLAQQYEDTRHLQWVLASPLEEAVDLLESEWLPLLCSRFLEFIDYDVLLVKTYTPPDSDDEILHP